MNLRVLLIEAEAEELLFLQDVLREIEEQHWLKEWPQIEPQYAATWAEAERMISTSPPHAILLDLELNEKQNLNEKQGAETFCQVQAAAPDVPVIVLIPPGGEELAVKLVREGAEDFLFKQQVDCAPLAHALRNAVLRRRELAAVRAASRIDALTGLANRAGFLAMAERDCKLAERLKRRWMLLVAEPRNLVEIAGAFGEQRWDLELVAAAEHLRGIATPADLVARIGDRHFAVGVFDSELESVEEAWVRVRSAAAERRIAVGASIFAGDRPLSLDAMIEQAVADLPGRSSLAGAAAGASGACDHSSRVPIGLDATYSLGRNPSGVAVYSREMLWGLARAHPEEQFRFYYRPHRFLRSFREALPPNGRRRILRGAPRPPIFHALNQRLDGLRSAARRTVTTFHDLFVMTAEYSSPEFRARFAEQARRAAERSDLIIAVSAFTARQVEELLGVEPSRIRVIPHGTRLPAKSWEPELRENLVLTVGAVQKRKNIARLVKAFEKLPKGWKLAIAGAAEGYGAAEELRAVAESPRRGDIEVLGYVSREALEELYGRARIFAFPSLDEGFGMPVLDAMARGVAVVASRRSAIPEVAGDAALLVDPEDVAELGAALRLLAEDDGRRQDLVRRGLARAAEFTWEAAVERTWKVYRELR